MLLLVKPVFYPMKPNSYFSPMIWVMFIHLISIPYCNLNIKTPNYPVAITQSKTRCPQFYTCLPPGWFAMSNLYHRVFNPSKCSKQNVIPLQRRCRRKGCKGICFGPCSPNPGLQIPALGDL